MEKHSGLCVGGLHDLGLVVVLTSFIIYQQTVTHNLKEAEK